MPMIQMTLFQVQKNKNKSIILTRGRFRMKISFLSVLLLLADLYGGV